MPSPPASSPPPTSPPFVSDRFVPELRPVRGLTPLAARAFCKAQDLLGLVFARGLAQLRSDLDPLERAQGKIEEQAVLLRAGLSA